ncbi:MAG: metallopeptidase TldD-related protein [Burkholderiaceae bacterium]
MATELQNTAERALTLMRAQGFEHAQVSVIRQLRAEVNVAHNEPSLLRSNEAFKLQLMGLLDGRRAATEGSELDEVSLTASVQALWRSVAAAPQDAANAVSTGQHAHIVRGALEADVAVLAGAMGELLAWRESETPTMMIEEALAAHNHVQSHTLTSGGSDLACELGWFDAAVFGLAREGAQSSSFNFAGGACDELAGSAGMPFIERFGIHRLMRSLTRQVRTQALGERFVGSVVLTPRAAADLFGWLLGQLSDQALIDASSVYRHAVGEAAASPLLTLRSRFDAPGVAGLSADAFVTAPVELLSAGRLNCLTPSLYGSRKTGLAHVPVAAQGWEVLAGNTLLDQIIASVARGALVDRLSMGRPAANGDFSGVIKNSFAIRSGEVGAALAETMISGNVAQMLRDVSAVSAERIDSGAWVLPWLRVDGLHFS